MNVPIDNDTVRRKRSETLAWEAVTNMIAIHDQQRGLREAEYDRLHNHCVALATDLASARNARAMMATQLDDEVARLPERRARIELLESALTNVHALLTNASGGVVNVGAMLGVLGAAMKEKP